MSVTLRRGIVGPLCKVLCRGLIINADISTVRPNTMRFFSLTPSKMSDAGKEVKNTPIKFSTSEASHRTWKVQHSFGNGQQQPLWKVFCISLLTTCFLLWCALRGEREVDAKLEQPLNSHLPGILPDEEQGQTKSS